MAKQRKKFASDTQGDLFRQMAEASPLAAIRDTDLDLGPEMLGALHKAIRHAKTQGWGRERIVERMNRVLPELAKPITLRQLYNWTATSKEFSEFPVRYLPAFCWATQCDEPLRVLNQALGFDLVDARERLALELGQLRIERARASREERAILNRFARF